MIDFIINKISKIHMNNTNHSLRHFEQKCLRELAIKILNASNVIWL